MNRVQINEKDVDSIFDLDCTSMVMICGWKGIRVQNDHEKRFLEIYIERTISVLL